MYNFKQGYYADVRIEDRFTTNVTVRNGMTEQAKENVEVKAFIRVFDGKMWYYTSTDDVNNVQGALDELYKYATPDKDIESNPIVKLYQTNKAEKLLYTNSSVRNVPLNEKLKLVTETSAKMTSKMSNFKVALYIDRNSLYHFYSSKGADITYDFQTAGEAYVMVFNNNGETLNMSLQQAKLTFDALGYDDKAVADMITEGENFIVNAKSVTAGSYPVVFAPVVTGVFAHESFGHKSESDFMLGDETMAKEWVLGKKVGSDLLTIRESGMHLGSGYVPFDDEGTACTDTYLIKNGVLCGRLHSATTAAALGENLTGNAPGIALGRI